MTVHVILRGKLQNEQWICIYEHTHIQLLLHMMSATDSNASVPATQVSSKERALKSAWT